jgi:RNA polymerase sigma factor (TIGR02999 family)
MLPDDLTTLLNQARQDANVLAQLYNVIQAELLHLAGGQMRGERRDAMLDTSVLVNEAFERLYHRPAVPAGDEGRRWADRTHFFRHAASVMRWIRVEYARKRKTTVPLAPDAEAPASGSADQVDQDDLLLALDRELHALARQDPQAAEVFVVRFFGVARDPASEPHGRLLSEREAAEQLGLSRDRLRKPWRRACSYLARRLPALGLTEEGGVA